MIAPDRLKLRTTVMSIGAATEAAGGFQQANSRSNTSFSVLTWVPGSTGAVAGPRVAGWLGCGFAGKLGDGACAQACEAKMTCETHQTFEAKKTFQADAVTSRSSGRVTENAFL